MYYFAGQELSSGICFLYDMDTGRIVRMFPYQVYTEMLGGNVRNVSGVECYGGDYVFRWKKHGRCMSLSNGRLVWLYSRRHVHVWYDGIAYYNVCAVYGDGTVRNLSLMDYVVVDGNVLSCFISDVGQNKILSMSYGSCCQVGLSRFQVENGLVC